MKNLIYLLLLATVSFSSVQAQNSDADQMQKGLEEMEQDLTKVFSELEKLFSQSPLTKDSTFTKMFAFPLTEMDAQFDQMDPDSMQMGDMFNILEKQMQQFSQQDFSELENFFKNFGEQLQLMPIPNLGDENLSPEEKKKKKKTSKI